MKKVLRIVAIIFSLMNVVCVARNAQELFLRANKYYERNEWRKALDEYDAIERKGSAVWYNMGNCLYQLGEFSHAIVCWKRATRGATVSEVSDSTVNSNLAYTKLGNPGRDTILRITEWGVYGISTLPAQLLFLFCWYLFWLLGFGVIRCRKLFFYCLVIGLCFVMIVLGNILLEKYYMQRDTRGIVMKKESQLFAGPHVGYHPVGAVSLADELCVCEKRPGWYKVLGHDAHGWIPSSNLEII